MAKKPSKQVRAAATYLLARHTGLFKPYFPASFYNEGGGLGSTVAGSRVAGGYLLSVGKGTFNLAGVPITVTRTTRSLQLSAGSFAMSGKAVTLPAVSHTLHAGAGSFVLTGQNINELYSSLHNQVDFMVNTGSFQ